MVETARPRTVPAVLQDRYRVDGVIGTGGASTVLRARDELLGRDVAIKLFTARAIEPGDLATQEAEARMLAALNHHALVTLLDAGIDLTDPTQPQVYLVLELVQELDLRTRLRSGPLDPLAVAYLGFDLAGGIGYVHAHGIVHRDVKPANVLLADLGTDRVRGKLADFGIAMLRAAAGRPEEQTTGTAAYLSPEQVEGRPLGPPTDVYSLGLVLLEALTGAPAYTGTVVEAALARLERQPAIPASVPRELAELITAMTARRPADRPAPAEVELGFRRVLVGVLGSAQRGQRVSEADRVAALHRYDLLDTPPDGAFDRIAAMAARLTGMPIALVGLADADRLWFKSRVGVTVTELPLPALGVKPGGVDDGPVVVDDPASVPAAEAALGVRSFTSVPLRAEDGVDLGVLAVADRRPRTPSAEDLRTLQDLAALVVHEMELRIAVRRAVQLRR